MKQEYIELVNNFKKLLDDEKKEEILKNINQLLKLLYKINKSFDSFNEALPTIFKNYSDESEYYDALFTSVISLKEEIAKLINSIK